MLVSNESVARIRRTTALLASGGLAIRIGGSPPIIVRHPPELLDLGLGRNL